MITTNAIAPLQLTANSNCYIYICLQGIWIFSMIQYRPLSIAGYEYPGWAVALGWVIALMSVVCIPAGMIHAVLTTKGSTILRVILVFKKVCIEIVCVK